LDIGWKGGLHVEVLPTDNSPATGRSPPVAGAMAPIRRAYTARLLPVDCPRLAARRTRRIAGLEGGNDRIGFAQSCAELRLNWTFSRGIATNLRV
jgi:hypothetical protein